MSWDDVSWGGRLSVVGFLCRHLNCYTRSMILQHEPMESFGDANFGKRKHAFLADTLW